MTEIEDGVDLYEVIIPVVCLTLCFGFQTWEFVGSHKDIARARKLFAEVRAGWVTSNYMKGQAAVNTTRDYIRAAVFFANTAIILGTFAVGYAGTIYSECPEDGCSGQEWLYIVKLAVLSALLVVNFFVFTQCTRFAVHFSFCINTEELDGVPLPHSLIVKVFNHSYKYYSLGIRLYFGTIPVFAWIFHSFAMVAVTLLYIYMVRGLENADFLRAELDDIKKAKDARSTA